MLLFVDSETTGLLYEPWGAGRGYAPPTNPLHPHVVQLGAVLTDAAGNEIAAMDKIVYPDGYTIPPTASNIHGITTERAREEGIPLRDVLSEFSRLRASATKIIMFNVEFDQNVLRAALHRIGMSPYRWDGKRHVCCMRRAKPICNLPPSERMIAARVPGPKTPKLTEAHAHFFGAAHDGAHNAADDARACARVWFAMEKL